MKTSGGIIFSFSFVPRGLAGWLLLFSLGAVSAASASDVEFSSGGYAINGSSVTLSMDNIENFSPHQTGALRMELFAFTSPYTGTPGAVTAGFRMAVSPSLGSLAAGSFFTTSPVKETAAFSAPTVPGTYYVTLALTEYQNGSFDDGYVSVNVANFSVPYVVNASAASNGAAFGFSSAVSVGGGYYYDTDVGYIYPLDNGFIYVSNLNQYFYVDPGTDFTTGTYIYDFARGCFTYTEKSFWPYVYYFNGTGWVDTGFN